MGRNKGRRWVVDLSVDTTNFLAAAVEHIPDRYHHTSRYYSVYSNRSCGIARELPNPTPASALMISITFRMWPIYLRL